MVNSNRMLGSDPIGGLHHMRSALALLTVLALATLTLSGCGRQPNLSPSDIARVRFTALQSGETYSASDIETQRFVECYSNAANLTDDLGTTAAGRIDVLLVSGEHLVVTGGEEPYQTVELRGRQYNIKSKPLHQMLQRIAFDGATADGKPSLITSEIENARVVSIPTGSRKSVSDDEVDLLLDAYEAATVLDEIHEITPSARVDVPLRTGTSVAIWTDGVSYPLIEFGMRRFSVDGAELASLLDSITAENGKDGNP